MKPVRLLTTDLGDGIEWWVNPDWVCSVRGTPRTNLTFVDLVGAEGHFVEGKAEDVAALIFGTKWATLAPDPRLHAKPGAA